MVRLLAWLATGLGALLVVAVVSTMRSDLFGEPAASVLSVLPYPLDMHEDLCGSSPDPTDSTRYTAGLGGFWTVALILSASALSLGLAFVRTMRDEAVAARLWFIAAWTALIGGSLAAWIASDLSGSCLI